MHLRRKSYISFILGLSFAVAFSPSISFCADTTLELNWLSAGADISFSKIVVPSGGLFGSELTLIRTGLRQHRIGVIRASEFGLQRASAKAMCKSAGALACINANFFDKSGDALGLVVSRGILHQKMHRGGSTLTGIFQVTRQGPSIVSRQGYDPSQVLEAVQAGPRLIVQGSPVAGLKESGRSGRAGVCLDKGGFLIMFAAPSGVGGLTIEELQSTLLNTDLGCTDAINFDGGGSAQLYFRQFGSKSASVKELSAEGSEIEVPGRDDVPVVLALFRR